MLLSQESKFLRWGTACVPTSHERAGTAANQHRSGSAGARFRRVLTSIGMSGRQNWLPSLSAPSRPVASHALGVNAFEGFGHKRRDRAGIAVER
jgi:hypothetical protein